jgi:hypothetical protein
MIYGREALRRLREQQERAVLGPERQSCLLAQIPADAPMDNATITVWNGERFVAWDNWRATAPLIIQGAKAADRKVATSEEADARPQDSPLQRGLW